MSEQYAGLSLGVDVSEVDKAVKSLDNFARANERAADGVDEFINAEQVAKQRLKDTNEELKRQGKEYGNLVNAIDPTARKMKELQKNSEKLDSLWKKGMVPDAKFFELSEMLETQNNALVISRKRLTEDGRAALENSRAKARAKAETDNFLKSLQQQAQAATMTRQELLELRAAQLGVSTQAAPFISQITKQSNAMNLAGLSAGEYKNAMRMLPAQITDVVTSLASGMPVWLVAIQQGGQIKDSFGGVANTFKVLASYINPMVVLLGALGSAFAVAGFKVLTMNKQIQEAQKLVKENLGMTGEAANNLASGIYDIADATGKTVKEVSEMFVKTTDGADESIKKMLDVGFSYKDARDMVNQYKESGDFTNLNQSIEEHKKRVEGIKAAWYENIPAMLNYNKGVDYSQSQAGGGNLGVLRNAIDLQETMNGLVKTGNEQVAQTSLNINKQYLSLNKVAGAQEALNIALREQKKVSGSTDEQTKANAAYIVKQREKELELAKKAEKEKNKPKKEKTSPIVRAPTEQLDKELYTLQAQLKVLQDHKEIGEKISSQRKALWVTEASIANLEDAQSKRRLSAEEKSLLTNQKEVLEKAKLKASVGDQIVEQEKLNALQDKSLKFVTDMDAATKALNETRSMGNIQAQRETEKQRITADWLSNGGKVGDSGLQKELEAQDKFYAEEDAKRADWLAGAENAFANYGEAATDMYGNVGQVASAALDGMADMMTDFLMTGKADFADFAKSIISMIIKMIAQMVIFNTISGMMGGGTFSFGGGMSGKANGGVVGGTFAGGGYTGSGGKYQPAGVVHKGEFVMTKEATRRIGIANLYRLMRGYASGGAVGGTSGITQSMGSGGGFSLAIGSIPININNGGDPQSMEKGIKAIVTQMLTESCTQGGEIFTYVNSKTGG